MVFDVGVPCKKGHTCGRYIVSRKCVQCAKDAASAWNKANPDKHAAHVRRDAEKRAAEVKAQQKRWRQSNPDRIKQNNARWQAENYEKYLSISSSWKKRNRPHVTERARRYALARDNRTPPWLTQAHLEDIKKFYQLAADLSAAYGSPWHVDHIMPLNGATVSGLHVPWNLQVLPGSDNMRKGNRVNV